MANFINLAEKGFYNGTKFHRVIPTFVAQGGDPTETGMGDAGYHLPFEPPTAILRRHFPGSLAMARGRARDSASCQFYLSLGQHSHIDEQYVVFGRVVEGMDVLNEILPADIMTVRVLSKRNHSYQAKTLPLTAP